MQWISRFPLEYKSFSQIPGLYEFITVLCDERRKFRRANFRGDFQEKFVRRIQTILMLHRKTRVFVSLYFFCRKRRGYLRNTNARAIGNVRRLNLIQYNSSLNSHFASVYWKVLNKILLNYSNSCSSTGSLNAPISPISPDIINSRCGIGSEHYQFIASIFEEYACSEYYPTSENTRFDL